MRKKLLNLAIVAGFSLLGGFLAQTGFAVTGSYAQGVSGAPIFIYGDDGQVRIQMGTYSAAGERGLPLVGLGDNHGHIRMLFRLAGPNESPVIIMKDTKGVDKLVMGLDLSDPAQAPFLSVIDANGQKQNLFGKY